MEKLVGLVRLPGYDLVAEGVETDAVLEHMTALGFSYAQGFAVGAPADLRPRAQRDRQPLSGGRSGEGVP